MAGSANAIKKVSCPHCSGSIELRSLGKCSTAACVSCGTIVDVSDPNIQRVIQFQRQVNAEQCYLPIGARARFGEHQFEVIGFMVRCDSSREWRWHEYLLFNPYQGFRWLVCNQGHWSFVTPLTSAPDYDGGALRHNGLRFSEFLRDSAEVVYVLGEFFWEVKVGDTNATTDYISPPYMISLERDRDEDVWSRGEYLTPSAVEKAFTVPLSLPFRSGVGAHQPAPGAGHVGHLAIVAGFFVIALFFVHLVLAAFARTEIIGAYSGTITPNVIIPPESVSTELITIPGTRIGNLEIKVNAPVDNSWASFDVDLTNTSTGEKEEGEVEVAFYHGVDSDGSWSEGSTLSKVILPSVMPGQYVLAYHPTAGPLAAPLPFTISLRRNVAYWGNYGIVFFLIIVYPITMLILRAIFEAKRWQQSSVYGSDE